PWLDRDDVSWLEERGVRARAAEPRALVNGEAHAVAQAVDVALHDLLVGAHGGVALALEHVAHQLLVAAAGLAAAHLRHRSIERLAALAVDLLQRLGRWPEAERARHVGVVAAARLSGEDVDEDRRARAHRVLVVAAVVRNAGVTALRDDALAVLGKAKLCKSPVQEPAQVAECRRPAVAGDEALARPASGGCPLERRQLVAHALHRLDGAARAV